MSVPVRVQGYDADGREWHEMSSTDNASYGGASFALKHEHGVGQVVLLSLPLPRNFRRYSLTDTSYRTYALIRVSRATGSGPRTVGVMFLGRTPPRGFEANPGGRYLLPGDQVDPSGRRAERRRHQRLPLFVNLRVARAALRAGDRERAIEELRRGFLVRKNDPRLLALHSEAIQ